jgi:glycosyltransferase involved in cell wall biosynthesis
MFFSPHAVDNDYFRRGAERLRPRREELRKAWQVPVSGTVFLFAGKFIPSKRPEDFARAIGEAARHEAGITGLMVGDGPLRSRLEELARAHDWPVRFTGFLNQSQMPEAYACSDALVVTSESETWGLVVNEAMSSGLPVIVNDQVGCSDDLVDAATGKTYCCGDVPELAEHLVRLAREPEHRRALGEAASQHVDKYSITRAVQGVLETVRHVAAPRSLYLPTRSAHDG